MLGAEDSGAGVVAGATPGVTGGVVPDIVEVATPGLAEEGPGMESLPSPLPSTKFCARSSSENFQSFVPPCVEPLRNLVPLFEVANILPHQVWIGRAVDV